MSHPEHEGFSFAAAQHTEANCLKNEEKRDAAYTVAENLKSLPEGTEGVTNPGAHGTVLIRAGENAEEFSAYVDDLISEHQLTTGLVPEEYRSAVHAFLHEPQNPEARAAIQPLVDHFLGDKTFSVTEDVVDTRTQFGGELAKHHGFDS